MYRALGLSTVPRHFRYGGTIPSYRATDTPFTPLAPMTDMRYNLATVGSLAG